MSEPAAAIERSCSTFARAATLVRPAAAVCEWTPTAFASESTTLASTPCVAHDDPHCNMARSTDSLKSRYR
jgi:hypothetical protein